MKSSNHNRVPDQHESGLSFRVKDGDAFPSDPEFASIHSDLESLASAERGEPDAGFEDRMVRAAMAGVRPAPTRSVWLRIAAAAALASGVATAWLVWSAGGPAGPAGVDPRAVATSDDRGVRSVPKAEAELNAAVAELVIAISEDELSPEIDSLISDTHTLSTRLDSDWFEGGAM